MGYCVNCGAPTEGNNPVCSSCASLNSSNNSYNQQSSFNQVENLNRYDNLISITKTKPQRTYWRATFDNPSIAYEQVFKDGEPENDFDIGELKGKFNWGACLFNSTWLAFNCNFWLGFFIVPILLSIVSTVTMGFGGFFAVIGLMVYLGLKGNEIAWKTRPYKNLEEFKKNQKIWAWVAPVVLVLSFVASCTLFGAALIMGGLH